MGEDGRPAGRQPGAPAPVYGEIHKFGYTRPLKKHEQPDLDAEAEPAGDPSPPFVHLHVHSNFSFLDGGSRIEELVARAAELGQPALALTDHDGLYGAVRFAKACAKRGIKPIFGAEVRVESLLSGGERPGSAAPTGAGAHGNPGQSDPRSGAGDDPHHLVLLAETREGYANLCRLLSAAHLADPERERPPLVTLESLRSHAEGLICLTGCRHGEIGYLIDAGRDDRRPRGAPPPARHLRPRAPLRGAAVLRLRAPPGGARRPARRRRLQEGARHRQPAAARAGGRPGRRRHVHRRRLAFIASPLHCNFYCIQGRWYRPPRPHRRSDSQGRRQSRRRSDLPQGHPQRLNPSDYDVGFHRDDRPWRLSCLTYCLQLAALARACGLPTVLTTNAHYARGSDRAIHLICRAAGHDKPLSGYPDPAPGVRCLKAKAEIEALAAPLLELIAAADQPEDTAPRSVVMHDDCNATSIALYGAPPCDGSSPWDGASMHERCSAIDTANTGVRQAAPRQADHRADSPSPASNRFAEFRKPHRTAPAPTHVSPLAPTPTRTHCPASARRPGPLAAWSSPLDATAQIAARCNVDLELGTYHFPKVEVPRGETAYSLLAKRCFRGIARMYKPVPPRAVELLEKELRMIQQMGFAHYFLVVHDIVRWARAKGVACSGRGSAGNSIVCHALDITASEPIRHNLLFERFLNPNRREMPDIDVDFCSSRRDEVIEHIYKTFGNENVAVVANINTMSPRSAVRIVAEALGYAPTEINALAKHVPRHGDAARIREYLAGAWPELRDSPLQDSAPAVPPADGAPARPEGRYARLLDLVERLDSFPMHLGTHLGGFVITDRPITYYAPLQWAAKGVVVIQFNKDDVAALGLVKMDILGLRTHSAVSETVHLIRQRTGRRIRPYDLPPDDPAAYEIVSNGGSIGLFQLESAGQRNLASRLQERDFDDVIAAIALYRPGPLEAEMIGPFIDRRWGIEPVVLPHPAMAEAVADTYGVILYQEQVLRIAQSVAGFDLADADSLRRAMTRDRSREEMAKIGETFIGGAVARGVPEDAAREVFRQLEGFAAYGFNKSHSVCFAVIAYATAYLKAYYPAEFLCSILNNYPMGFYTPRTVLNDARRFGLEVRPLDINLSGRGFTVEDAVAPDPWAGAGTGVSPTFWARRSRR